MTYKKNTDFILFWLAGEKSGDTHAAQVMNKLNQSSTSFKHIGIGGPLMQEQGLKSIFPFEKFNVMGFVEVIKHLAFFSKVEQRIKAIFTGKDNSFNQRPDIVILVDYPGLNLRVAKIAYHENIKVLYYICPQFWAWKHHRVNKLAEYCDRVACILPFEKDLLDIHQISTSFVGHPITEEIDFKLTKDEFAETYQLDTNKKWISFFPGSRENEVKKLLPVFLKTIKILSKKYPDYEFLISKSNSISHNLFINLFLNIEENESLKNSTKLIDSHNHELMKYSDFMIVKSGTTTIESAFIGTPFAITYIANQVSYMIAKKIIKIKFIGLPNIILNEEEKLSQPVIPELIQENVSPKNIISTIEHYLNNPDNYKEFKDKLSKIKNLLGNESASENVKNLIFKLL